MFIEIGVVILGVLSSVHVYLIWAVNKNFSASLGQMLHRQEAIEEANKTVFGALSSIQAHVANIEEALKKEERDKLIKTLETNLDLLRQSSILASKQKEYKQFFSVILEAIQEDTKWLRSGLFQRFGEVPEYMEINSQIIAFENKVEQIKLTLKEYRMLDNYDE